MYQLKIKPFHGDDENEVLTTSELVKTYYNNPNDTTSEDSGIDLFCLRTIIIPANTRSNSISFGISCELHTINMYSSRQSGYWLIPRSSIYKTPLRMSNSVGLMDSGFRGELVAKVDNISDEDYVCNAGERLFQLANPSLTSMSYVVTDSLSDSTRGTGGFGSTGK